MTASKPTWGRWILVAVLVVICGLVAIPATQVVEHMVGNAVGRTTVIHHPDGSQRTVYWREYPGVSGINPQESLGGPTPEDGYATGQKMIAEIKDALATELHLEWAPAYDPPGSGGPFHKHVSNSFGGNSLLTVVNGTESQSTSVPQTWAGKQRALDIIAKVAAEYGFGAPKLQNYELWSDEDRIRDLGGTTPDQQVIVTGVAEGPTGQWLSFRFQDLSKDTDGRFAERLRPPEGTGWQMNTLGLSYGANGLLAQDDREEFETRFEPFRGLTPPPPLES